MSDTRIPIKKLSDKNGFYYPLTTLDSVFSNREIEVKNRIGNYLPGESITPNTSLQTILLRILNEAGETDCIVHLSNIDVDKLSEFSTRIPSSPLIAELLEKYSQESKEYTDEEVSRVEKQVIKAAHYKGSVDYYTDLPTDTAICGDIYNVRYKPDGSEDGSNYIFDEENKIWDKLSGYVDLTNVYTKSEIDQLLLHINDNIDLKANKTDVYTKSEVNNLVDNKADKVNTYTKEEVDSLIDNKADKVNTYTKSEVDEFLDDKADKTNVYTKEETYSKTEVDSLVDVKIDKTDVYTKSEVDEFLDDKADKTNVYTKTEVNNYLDLKVDKAETTGTIRCEEGKSITGIQQLNGKIVSVISGNPKTNVVINTLLVTNKKSAEITVDGETTSIYSDSVDFYIKETWHDQYSWYRLYNDDWCEQGGRVTANNVDNITINYHKTYKDSFATVLVTQTDSTGNDEIIPFKEYHDGNKIIISWVGKKNVSFNWKAEGYVGTQPIESVTVTFNANGGTVNPTTKTITKGTTIGTLPIPTRDKYIFKNWTMTQGGAGVISENTVFINNATIYAQWEFDYELIATESLKTIVTEDGLHNILREPQQQG